MYIVIIHAEHGVEAYAYQSMADVRVACRRHHARGVGFKVYTLGKEVQL